MLSLHLLVRPLNLVAGHKAHFEVHGVMLAGHKALLWMSLRQLQPQPGMNIKAIVDNRTLFRCEGCKRRG